MSTITLTKEQEAAVKGIKNWYKKENKQTCSLVGYAGTGKTFLVKHIIKELNLREHEVAFAAYTGKASLLLKQSNPEYNCSTIHRLIYNPSESEDTPTFSLKNKEELAHIKLIVIDEASMVSKEIMDDLLSFGKNILLIGDTGQLPPVEGHCSLLENPDYRLTEIHRQAKGNPIIHLSMLAREGKNIKPGKYGNNALVIKKEDIKKNFYQLCVRAEQIICGLNKTRKKINEKVRELMGFEEPVPQVGDKLICLKNSWDHVVDDFPLVNGMTGFAGSVTYNIQPHGRIKRKTIQIDFQPDFTQNQFKHLLLPYEDFDLQTQKVKFSADEYRLLDRFDFGYCITCHKSQGSQWDRVLVINEQIDKTNHNKWLYTAITRSKDKLILVV